MNYKDFLDCIIADGIEAVRMDYAHKPTHLDGALSGFEECRGLSPNRIGQLLMEANARSNQARSDKSNDYWYWRCRALEIEWVANVISAANMNNNLPTIVNPTVRGLMKAADILGMRESA